jgi:ribosomal protein S18 acetylase RimI-like enzyme
MLEAQDRRLAGPTAPAHGLYLQWVQTAPTALPPVPAAPAAPAARPQVNDAPIICEFGRNDVPEIVAVAQSLPQWFNDDGLKHLAHDLPFQRGFIALAGRRVVGFIAFNVTEGIGQITWLGVRPELHRRGICRRLIDRLCGELRRVGVAELRVDTLGPSVAYEPYERTRAFYQAVGFHELKRIAQDNPAWPERLTLHRNV